ncbi:class E basic helix-loop-helix protein 40 [Hetaerina americana]|uniref:class E basic helix-loop-helix protein 40 n=1 Tax=Hetaerina americana TaxID=62018 RepID=UPI003A7F4E20
MENAAWGEEEDRSSNQRDLNFGGTVAGHCEEDGDDGYRRRVSRDPMSHRIIEKRRRDRMNSCLADLSRLIPAEYLKRGRGRIEKTEIIEMAIRHMRHLQESQQPFLPLGQPTPPPTASSSSSSPGSCSSSPAITSMSNHQEVCEMADEGGGAVNRIGSSASLEKEGGPSDQYRLGFLECLSEALHFLIEIEGFPAGGALCLSLDAHLRNHCTSLLQGGPSSSTKSECTVDEEHHYQMELSRKKSLEHSSLDIPASEGEEMESMMQGGECHDCDAYHPREYRVMLSRKEERNGRGQVPTLPLGVAPEDGAGGGASYKFKSNIKRRFTAGLEKRRKFEESEEGKCLLEGGDESLCAPGPTPSNSLASANNNDNNLVNSLMPHGAPPPYLSSSVVQPSSTKCMNNNQLPYTPTQLDATNFAPPRIPVFALHAEHSFYVPLMLDPDMLAPHAPLLSMHASSALHPVTISVNFCSGEVDACHGRGGGEPRPSGCAAPPARDFPQPASPSALMESMCKQSYRHWRPADEYISQ